MEDKAEETKVVAEKEVDEEAMEDKKGEETETVSGKEEEEDEHGAENKVEEAGAVAQERRR